MDDPVTLTILVVAVVILLFLIWSTVHIVRQYERLVIFTLGRVTNGSAGPGLVLLVPIIQQPVKVDLREFYIELPPQTCITKDNAPISIDFLVYSKVFDPEQSVTAVTSFSGASQALAATTLLVMVGIWIADVMASMRKNQDCVLSGRPGCTRVEVPAQPR